MLRFPRTLKFVRAILLLAGVAHLGVTFTPLTGWWVQALSLPWHDTKTGGSLIVLSGSQVQPGILGYSSYWRSVAAVRAWRGGAFGSIVLTGDHSTVDSMTGFLTSQGVPADKIRREEQSNTTRESAVNCRAILREQDEPFVILTSEYHTRRSYGVFQRAGLRVTTRPAPDGGKRNNQLSERWHIASELALETVKLVYYRWQGWL